MIKDFTLSLGRKKIDWFIVETRDFVRRKKKKNRFDASKEVFFWEIELNIVVRFMHSLGKEINEINYL